MPPDNALASRVRTRLDEIDRAGLRRRLSPPAGVDLSSNDYLHLSRDPRVVARFVEGARREGCGSTGSRLLRGERDAFTAIERRFAAFKGAERSLYFSSGYLANIAVLSALADRGDVIFSDERNHASLIDGARLSRARVVVFPHNDTAALARALAEDVHAEGPGSPADTGDAVRPVRFVVVESLFSMDGDRAPLAEHAALCRATGAILVVDEAHAVGVCGSRGSGLLEDIDAAGMDHGAGRENVVLSINTAGKALGVAGAFVAGPAWAIEYLVQRARPFIFSTAPPPAVADAIDESLTIVEEEPARRIRLRAVAAGLRGRLRAAGLDAAAGDSHVIPILIGENEPAMAVAAALQHAGFDVRAIRPPTVAPGTARLRVSVHAGLDDRTLDAFVDALTAALREAGVCSAASS